MSRATTEKCLTCYGKGEVSSERGPEACPDCLGEGTPIDRGAKMEWRLRELERTYETSDAETHGDVVWLVHELRRHREALVRVFALCQDADEGDATAREVRGLANEALGLYDPSQA
jgi:hypothetical protein